MQLHAPTVTAFVCVHRLNNNNIGVEGCKALAAVLPHTKIEDIHLAKNSLVYETALSAYELAHEMKGLEIRVGNVISYQGREMTVTGIARNDDYMLADLSGIIALATSLHGCKSLRSLEYALRPPTACPSLCSFLLSL